MLMSALSPRSPLSLSSGSNGSNDDMQDNVPTSDIDTQSPNPSVLDGIRPHNITQLFETP